MLEHADAGDAVELAVHVPVVGQQNLAAIGQPGSSDAFPGEFVLVAGKRDAGAVGSGSFGGAQDQRAPAAADVEQALVRLQVVLAQHVVQLLNLRFFQAVRMVLEVGARINHVLVQPKPVEIVRNVVVVGDGLGIHLPRVVRAANDASEPAERPDGTAGQLRGDPENLVEVSLDVEISLNVGRTKRIQAGADQVTQPGGVGGANDYRRLFTQIERLPVPERDAHWNIVGAEACGEFFQTQLPEHQMAPGREVFCSR